MLVIMIKSQIFVVKLCDIFCVEIFLGVYKVGDCLLSEVKLIQDYDVS